jgi:hypothetical protein
MQARAAALIGVLPDGAAHSVAHHPAKNRLRLPAEASLNPAYDTAGEVLCLFLQGRANSIGLDD